MVRHILIAALGLSITCAVVGKTLFAQQPAPVDERQRPVEIEKRTPWTTSRVHGSPDPPPAYRAKVAFPHLKFDRPIVIAALPGSDRLLIAERRGKVFSFPDDRQSQTRELFFDLVQHEAQAHSIYGLAFHPDFADNRFLYLCYTVGDGHDDGTRVSRFTVDAMDPPTVDPGSEVLLLTWYSGGHNGGCLKFGPDGYLYISAGDGGAPSPPDQRTTGQDLSDLLSSVLRIDVDRQADSRQYAIPPDNPFVGTEGARPEVWAYGLRNPWRMNFDRATGDLWVGDVGWEVWEMVYLLQAGGNYGWSIVEGPQPVRTEVERGPTPLEKPVIVHDHSEARSITGGYVYRGRNFPDLVGAYIYGDFVTGKVWALRYDGQTVTWHRELADTSLQLVTFGENRHGELYLADFVEQTGQIYQLVPHTGERSQSEFPRRLSQTGLFTDVARQTPAPGVIPYEVNSPLWSHGAAANRFLAVPADGRIEFQPESHWQFPDGTVLVKTIFMPTDTADGDGPRLRVETQLTHLEDKDWRFYSYQWNEEQSDATLVDDGGHIETYSLESDSDDGDIRHRTWRFAVRATCALCHNGLAGVVLGVNTSQLNRELADGQVIVNQLDDLAQRGMFQEYPGDSSANLPRMVSPTDPSARLDARVRSYLHAQCAHCHRSEAGGAALIRLLYSYPLNRTAMIDAPPTQGTLGLSDARVVAPGDPFRSVLYYRMAKTGPGRMPRLGCDQVHSEGLELIFQWIRDLDSGGDDEPTDEYPYFSEDDQQALATIRNSERSGDARRAEAIRRLMANPRTAMALARIVEQGQLSEPVCDQVIRLATVEGGAVGRDLFERFLPPEERTRRVGEIISADQLLALPGNPQRGRSVFFEETTSRCASCHRIDGRGGTLGPDLSQIGAKNDRAALLESMLEPSKKIDPLFASYLVETEDGRILAGLLESRTEQGIVLRAADNRVIDIDQSEVKEMAPQARSFMPDLLLKELTLQDVADLLAFLETCQEKTDRE